METKETKQTSAVTSADAQKKGGLAKIITSLPPELAVQAVKAHEFKELLNAKPPVTWLKKHPLGGFDYLPIDKVELLLDTLFKSWSIKVINYQVIANSITVQVELTVKYYDGTSRTIHGLGAAPIHTEKGASPVDHSKILTDSVMKALPAAKSFAIKDAAEHLGEIFGRNVNRKDTANYIDLTTKSGLADVIDNIKI